MAESLRREQAAPAAGVWATLLQANAPTVISSLRACNVGSAIDRGDARIVHAGESEADSQYLLRSVPLPVGWPYGVTEGWTMLAEDRLEVRSAGGSVAFNVFGAEKA